MKNPIKNPWTSITGILILIISGLFIAGIIDIEQESALIEIATELVLIIAGLVALIAKDKGGGL